MILAKKSFYFSFFFFFIFGGTFGSKKGKFAFWWGEENDKKNAFWKFEIVKKMQKKSFEKNDPQFEKKEERKRKKEKRNEGKKQIEEGNEDEKRWVSKNATKKGNRSNPPSQQEKDAKKKK